MWSSVTLTYDYVQQPSEEALVVVIKSKEHIKLITFIIITLQLFEKVASNRKVSVHSL
jgi:hypothetical protein